MFNVLAFISILKKSPGSVAAYHEGLSFPEGSKTPSTRVQIPTRALPSMAPISRARSSVWLEHRPFNSPFYDNAFKRSAERVEGKPGVASSNPAGPVSQHRTSKLFSTVATNAGLRRDPFFPRVFALAKRLRLGSNPAGPVSQHFSAKIPSEFFRDLLRSAETQWVKTEEPFD